MVNVCRRWLRAIKLTEIKLQVIRTSNQGLDFQYYTGTHYIGVTGDSFNPPAWINVTLQVQLQESVIE